MCQSERQVRWRPAARSRVSRCESSHGEAGPAFGRGLPATVNPQRRNLLQVLPMANVPQREPGLERPGSLCLVGYRALITG